VPGQHYETFKYDLSDFVSRTKELLLKYNSTDPGLSTMAKQASHQALQVFQFVGQLDSFMYAVQKVRSRHGEFIDIKHHGDGGDLYGIGALHGSHNECDGVWDFFIMETCHLRIDQALQHYKRSTLTSPLLK
jgi:hypothetical protein